MSYKELHQQPVNLEQETLLDFLLYFATIQTSVGVQTSRINQNTMRIAETYGYELTVMMFQRNIAMTLAEKYPPEKQGRVYKSGHPVTALTRHRSRPLNFMLNAELSRLSWYIHDNKPDINKLHGLLDRVLQWKPVNRWIILLLISIANAAFCFLFGGDPSGALLVGIGTAAGFYVRQELNLRHAYHYLVVIVAAFISSCVVSAGAYLGITKLPEIALSTSVLYLIPGVPFINAMVDLLDGYMLNGVSRLVNAILIVLSITVGLSVSLLLWNVTLL